MPLSNKSNNNLITFIIVNYNGSSDTIKCIDSIATQKFENTIIKAIVVDNKSDQADLEKIKKHCADLEWVKFIDAKDNLGYFPAFNLAIEQNQETLFQNHSSIILCNNDLIFHETFVSTYLAKKYTPETLVVSPDVITLDGRHQNPHVIKRFTSLDKTMLKIYFTHYNFSVVLRMISRVFRKPFSKAKKHNSQFIYQGIGACYILRPQFFKIIPELDARVFLGGEEALLANQIIAANGKNYYDKDIKVTHAEGITFSKATTKWRFEQSQNSYNTYKDLL